MKKDREGEDKGKRRGFPSILGPPRRPSRHDNSASMLTLEALFLLPLLRSSFGQDALQEVVALEITLPMLHCALLPFSAIPKISSPVLLY